MQAQFESYVVETNERAPRAFHYGPARQIDDHRLQLLWDGAKAIREGAMDCSRHAVLEGMWLHKVVDPMLKLSIDSADERIKDEIGMENVFVMPHLVENCSQLISQQRRVKYTTAITSTSRPRWETLPIQTRRPCHLFKEPLP